MAADLDTLRTVLAASAETVAVAMWGEPTARHRHELRFGRHGSRSVDLRRGLWHDHEAGEGGDLLDLVRRERGCAFGEAVQHAAELVGIDTSVADARRVASAPKADGDNLGGSTENRGRALELWAESGPIAGTPAERYLRRRGIEPARLLTDPPGWPETLGWHSGIGALVVAVNDAETSLVVAVQRIFLTADGERARAPDGGKRAKLSLGPCKGNAAKLSSWPDPRGRWGLAEGPESALAATMLAGHEVWAALSAGNMANVTPPSYARVARIFADNDANAAGMKGARAAAAAFRDRGLEVQVLRVPKRGADPADLVAERAR
jgi:putative DNA primase/helicase